MVFLCHQTLQLGHHHHRQTHLASPGTAQISFSETYLPLVSHQMVVIYIGIYQNDKRNLLGIMTGTLSLH